jgi:hypothetical protein
MTDTIDYEVSFCARELLVDPRMKKFLRERESRHLENIAWLDEDLEEKTRLENIAWLDEDLKEKTHLENIAWLDEDLNEKRHLETRVRKVWHCGHGTHSGKGHYFRGLVEGTCLIMHDLRQSGSGMNTLKQYSRFKKEAKSGDIVFTHCSQMGGLTHYGIFTGEIFDEEVWGSRGLTTHSHLFVSEWIAIPQAMMGVGKNCTLYEVKRGDNNYQNYSYSILY